MCTEEFVIQAHIFILDAFFFLFFALVYIHKYLTLVASPKITRKWYAENKNNISQCWMKQHNKAAIMNITNLCRHWNIKFYEFWISLMNYCTMLSILCCVISHVKNHHFFSLFVNNFHRSQWFFTLWLAFFSSFSSFDDREHPRCVEIKSSCRVFEGQFFINKCLAMSCFTFPLPLSLTRMSHRKMKTTPSVDDAVKKTREHERNQCRV